MGQREDRDTRPAIRNCVERLTWDDLNRWAGEGVVRRARTYHREGAVSDLGISEAGLLSAWVRGTQRYAVSVGLDQGKFSAQCTCPYAYGACKHAVATLLEYLEKCKRGAIVPAVPPGDERWTLLAAGEAPADEDDDSNEDSLPPSRPSPSFRPYLEGHSLEELVELVEDLADRYPGVASELDHRRAIASQSIERLTRRARRAIRRAAAPTWEDGGWGGRALPNYERVHDYFRRLLAEGQADALLDLGAELLESARLRVEQVNDEGDTVMEVVRCMKIVLEALPRSNLSTADQILWLIQAELEDDYELLGETGPFWEREFDPSHWEVVAGVLNDEIEQLPPPGKRFGKRYHRERRVQWLVRALESARLEHEILPLLRREAELADSYEPLVDRLVATGQLDQAREWIRTGVLATRQERPSIAEKLRESLIRTLETEGQVLPIASLRAQDFFSSPSSHTYQSLREAAQRAEVWPPVREAALHFLESGERPAEGEQDGGAPSAWPLPPPVAPPIGDESVGEKAPFVSVLIEVALAEKRIDDLLHWYDLQKPETGPWRGPRDALRVAGAVVGRYPERAIQIWREEAEREISRTDLRCYRIAADHLRRVREVLADLGDTSTWEALLSDIRERHRRKRLLMEILDSLEGTPIIDRMK